MLKKPAVHVVYQTNQFEFSKRFRRVANSTLFAIMHLGKYGTICQLTRVAVKNEQNSLQETTKNC